MPYTKTIWAAGNRLSIERLNKMEGAIEGLNLMNGAHETAGGDTALTLSDVGAAIGQINANVSSGNGILSQVWFACPKAERGSVATDWRPSWADILALPYVESWLTPSFLNGWTEVSGYPARYCKDASGFVHFKGRCAWAATGNMIPVPVGYRPMDNQVFALPNGNTSTGICRVQVLTSGYLYCDTTLPVGTWVDLSGICYRVEV